MYEGVLNNASYADIFFEFEDNETKDQDNCCKYLQQCHVYDETDFTKKCLELIDASTSKLIKDGKLNDLSETPLLLILERDSLNVKEVDLFKGLLQWAENFCKTNGIEASIQAIREKFKIFEKVRFPTMSMEEFSYCNRMKNTFFTSEEILNIFQYISNGAISNSLKYSTNERTGFMKNFVNDKIVTFNQLGVGTGSYSSSATFYVTEMVQIIKFEIDPNNAADIKLQIKILKNDQILFDGSSEAEKELLCDPFIILHPLSEYILETLCSSTNKFLFEVNDEVFKFPTNFETYISNIAYKTMKKQN